MFTIKNIKLNYTEIIVLGTLLLIILGAFLLSMPVSSKAGLPTPFIDALFTAASAFCVTGLVIYDTYTHWSLFGQLVILLLIQVGGLGFMTVITLFSIFLRRKIGLKERRLLMESANTLKIGGIVLLVKKYSYVPCFLKVQEHWCCLPDFILKWVWQKACIMAFSILFQHSAMQVLT